MRLPVFGTVAMLSLLSAPLSASANDAGALKPPATRTERVVDVYNDVSVADPYRWLEDQTAPETRAWIDAQNGRRRLRPAPGTHLPVTLDEGGVS